MQELKIKISDKVGVGLDQLVFKRGGNHGVELLEDDDSLKQAQFYNHICLYLERGQPSVLGQKRIQFLLAKSSHIFLQEITVKNPEDSGSGQQNAEALRVPDNCFFSFEQLAEIPCKTACKVSLIKNQVISHLTPLFPHLNLGQLDPDQIRLREKTGEDKLTTVLHESRELTRYQIYDGKEIALQILPEVPQEPAEMRDQSYLAMVKLWDPSDWTLSDLVEVYVPKTATLDDFGQLLDSRFGASISRDNIMCTKINSSWNFSRV